MLTDLGLVMDPAAMLHVEEQRPGVHRRRGAEPTARLLGEGSRVVQVLAAQQWLATPLPLALEMLAAHVMPNHPAITALVERGGRPARAADRQRRARRLRRRPRAGRRDRAGDRRGHARAAASATASRRSAGPTSASRCARRATSSPGGSARRWTPSSSWPPPWSRPASGRCCGSPRGTRSSATGARSGQRRVRRHHRRRPAGQPGRPRADRPGRDDAAHVDGRARRRPAPPGLHRLADRRARPDPRRHRRPPRPPRRHPPAAGPRPGRRRRPAGRRVPAGRAQRPGHARARRRRRRRRSPRRRRGCSSGRTRCSTSACATG